VWYTLSGAAAGVALPGVAEARGRRHGVEEVPRAGEGEVGPAHHEVRSWAGCHHHMTLSLLALWFLTLEKRRLGKNAGADGASAARGVRPTAAARTAQPAANRRGGQPGVTPE
jgi:SRSO17 transposase